VQQISIDFDVWKELTARRQSEQHSYNAVLRDLLGLEPVTSPTITASDVKDNGRVLGGRYLPNGTKLRAKYKDSYYFAEIADGRLLGEGGRVFGSASAAARAVTNTNVNGLNFWEVCRPSDEDWSKLLELPRLNK
jgi:hypothetical protein